MSSRLLLVWGIALGIQGMPVWAYGGGTERVTYRFADTSLEFVRYPRQALTVTAGCVAGAGAATKCEALRALERVTLRGLRVSVGAQSAGPRPEAVLCARTGGRVIKGTLEAVGENSFCLYRDRSALDLGSLMSFAQRRDAKAGR